eukprot:297333-Pyramimonas_sp.AAC.1
MLPVWAIRRVNHESAKHDRLVRPGGALDALPVHPHWGAWRQRRVRQHADFRYAGRQGRSRHEE